MKTTALGKTGLRVTPIGFGAWAIGGGGYEFGWPSQPEATSVHAIERALELGINWIDSAPVYGFGRSERIVGAALSGAKNRPYVFTKVGLDTDAMGKSRYSLRRDKVLASAEASLARLRVDAIDVLQVHWPIPARQIEEGWNALVELRDQGIARHIGVCNFDRLQTRLVRKIAPVETLQTRYSLVSPEAQLDILPSAAQAGLGVLAYSPMGSGLLTGSMTRKRIAALPSDDWRKTSDLFREPLLSGNLAIADRVRRVALRHNVLPGAVAVSWVLRNPVVSGAIVGFRHAKQVQPVLDALSVELTPDDIGDLEVA